MSKDTLSAGTSPEGPGAGVSKLNRLPLGIIGVIGVLTVGAMSWAVYQRSAAQRLPVSEKEEVIQQSGMGNMLNKMMAGYEGVGVVDPPKPEVEVPDTETVFIPAKTVAPPPPHKTPAPEHTAPVPPIVMLPEPEIPPEVLARQQRLQQLNQLAWQATLQALQAPTAVSGFQAAVEQRMEQQESGPVTTTERGAGSRGSLDYRALQQQALQQQQQQARRLADGTQTLAGLLSGNGINRGVGRTAQALGYGQAASGGGAGSYNRQQQGFTYSSEQRQAQRTRTELRVGALIPAVLIGGINSDLPGEMLAQVAEDVRDTRTGAQVLIPQGSKLVGRYSSAVEEGQERVLVAWYRVNFPDGSSLNLDAMNGVDEAGFSGFHDQVNKHTVDKFKEATLLSLISGAAQLSQAGGDEAARRLTAALGQQWGQVGQEVVKRKLDRAATLEIRPGYRFNVFINKDLILMPYRAMAPMSNGGAFSVKEISGQGR